MLKKKLTLKKETVRLLSDKALSMAVGGTTSETAGGCGTGGLCMSAYTCPVQTADLGCTWSCHTRILE